MPSFFRPHSLLLGFFLLLSACAVSQPKPNTGSKNKKANEFFFKALEEANFGKFTEALDLLDKALKKDDNFVDAYAFKGDILYKQGKFSEAELCFKTALEKNPDAYEVHLYLGEMYFDTKRYEEAEASLNSYLATPGLSEARRYRATRYRDNAAFAKEAVKNPVPFTPKNAGPSINSESREYFPGITVDGEYFIFTRVVGQNRNEDFFYCKKINDTTWGPAINLGAPVNTEENEGSVSVSADGQFIFFTSCNRSKKNTLQGRQNGAHPREIFPGCDLYYSRLEGTKWSIPRHMGSVINSNQWESTPSLSFDGLNLYFASKREGGYGGSDIWVSTFENGRFGEPVNLGPEVNTIGNEETPFIHPDNQTLYFSSDGKPGMGGYDFYVSRRKDDGSWDTPQNLGYPINTGGDEKGLMVNSKGELAYYSSDNRPDSYGAIDIYQFELPAQFKPQKLNYAKAIVLDDETGQPLEASAELFKLSDGSKVIATSTNTETGSFLVVLQANQDYALNISKEGYLFHSENFSLSQGSKDKPFELVVRLKKIKAGTNVVLKNVFYDVNSFELRKESQVELDKLASFLEANPAMKIEIGGHTDNTGNAAANQKLSENRAKSVMEYLIAKGIAANRLSYKGYGATKAIADNASEEGRQLNRRTEYKIISN